VPVSRRTKKAKRAPGIPLAKLESRFEIVQAAWVTVGVTMDRKRLNVAKKGGLILKDIKKALKREGKSLAVWHEEQEAAGKIRVTLRTLQKWMRAADKWPAIEAKATEKGLDPNELGLDEALALAAKPRRRPTHRQAERPGVTPTGTSGLEGKYKLKITCEVSSHVRVDLTSDELQALLDSREVVLKIKLTITDSAGRPISKVFDAEAAPEVAVEEWLE